MNAHTQDPVLAQVAPVNTETSALVLDATSMNAMMSLASTMAKGRATLPKHFHENPADCLAVIMQSMQWQMNPFAVAQKTHLVNGVLGYEAQLVNAVITSRAPTKDRLRYEWFGEWGRILGKFVERESKTKKDDNGYPIKYRVPGWDLKDEHGLGVKVWATFRGEDAPRELTLLMTQARTRNSTLWADDPRQQLAYLATKRWSRLYCPDVILGVYTPDELEEPIRDVTPPPAAGAGGLPEVTAEEFAKKMLKWRPLVENGTKTAAEMLVFAAAKYTLTEEQKAAILALKIATAETADNAQEQPQ